MSIQNNLNSVLPQGNYETATRAGNLIYTAGITPRINGELILTGKISENNPISIYKKAMICATQNAIEAIEKKTMKKYNEFIKRIVLMKVYINSEPDFESHSKIADISSEQLYNYLGHKSVGSRVAVGVNSLPGNSVVELQLVAEVDDAKGIDKSEEI